MRAQIGSIVCFNDCGQLGLGFADLRFFDLFVFIKIEIIGILVPIVPRIADGVCAVSVVAEDSAVCPGAVCVRLSMVLKSDSDEGLERSDITAQEEREVKSRIKDRKTLILFMENLRDLIGFGDFVTESIP